MIVVAIIAILATIAYPSYVKQIQRTRRADGRELLMRVSAGEERYFTTFNKYTTSLADLGLSSSASEKGYYNVALANGATGSTQSYKLSATPVGTQASDACLILSIDNTGKKDYTGGASNGSCW